MSAGDPNGTNPAALMMEQMNQSWKASLGLWSAWADTWRSVAENRAAPAAKAMMEGFSNPASWPGGLAPLVKELEDIFGLPRFADVPSLDSGALPSVAPAIELMAVTQQYLLAVAPIWVKVCQRFQAEVADRRQRGEAMDSSGEAMDLWNTVLDQTLMEFNRSAEFAAVQQRFLHAAMRQRLEVRKLAERAAQAVDLPTRTEMDDVYRRLHDLVHEVHGLRRELRALKQAGAERPKAGAKRRK
jgi:polyhydroxyalkanoate synthase subunit PhaE